MTRIFTPFNQQMKQMTLILMHRFARIAIRRGTSPARAQSVKSVKSR